MRTRYLLISTFLLLAVGAVTIWASPVELYLVKFAPGTDIYRLAGSQDWPVYHISGQQALMGKYLSNSDNKAVLESNLVYRGSSENLRWVNFKRSSPIPAIKTLYLSAGTALAESGNVSSAGIKNSGQYMVKPFKAQPMVMTPPAVFRTTSIARDTAVASLVHLIDTAQVRTRIEAMQSFGTRFLDAANHDSVVGWTRNQFLDMGITDVRTDTFDIGYGMQQHNIIATIPGLLDTSVVYIVGGHYDTYSPDVYNQAPGADDNASGTVAALEMARVLSLPGNQPNCTVRFIAFDAEEYGLFGSEYYAQKALSEGMNIGCMLNYDMIGYKGNDSTFVSKLNPGSEGYAYMLGQMAGWYGRLADTNLVPSYNSVYLNGSDSWEFSIRGFPVTYSEELNFSTVYHQTNDSTTYMSMRYATSIIKAGMGLLGTLANYPQKVEDVTATDIGTGSALAVQWPSNIAANVTGYNIYYGYNSGDYPYSLHTTATGDTLEGLTANAKCYITVRAVDNEGRESPMATEAIGVPVLLTLDQGILVVDETQDWTSGSFPRDTTQDKYYDSLLAGYTTTKYQYSSSGQKPGLVQLAPYSTVFWHADDYSQLMLNGCLEDLKLYLGHGGRLCLVGWKPSADITGSITDTAHYTAGSFMYDYMKVSQLGRSLVADSFQGAAGKMGYPGISVDPAKVPVTSWAGTMRYIENLIPVSPAEGIYDIDMKNDGSAFEGINCGVRYLGSDFKTALLGFPLYFMDQTQARAVVQKIMEDFGEVNGVSGKPEAGNRMSELKLSQNVPNPFAGKTTISYQLSNTGKVTLSVYNIAGQLVKALVSQEQGPGVYSVRWDRRDDHNRQVSAGVYIYHLNIGDQAQSRKMIVIE